MASFKTASMNWNGTSSFLSTSSAKHGSTQPPTAAYSHLTSYSMSAMGSNLTNSLYSVTSSIDASTNHRNSRPKQQKQQQITVKSATTSGSAAFTSTPTKIKTSSLSTCSNNSSGTSTASSRLESTKKKVIALANELIRVCRSLGFEYDRDMLVSVSEIDAKLFVFFYESIVGSKLESIFF